MLKAIIADDEEFARSSLFFLLQQHCPEVEINGIARSVAEARELLEQQKTDLVFLDIAMPGENGFELLPAISRHQAMVIFTTAYDQYAIKAIKANALDYLLKPIDIDELMVAVGRAAERKNLTSGQLGATDRLQNLAGDLSARTELKKITLPNGQGFRVVELDNIVHIEADSNYSVFNLVNLEKITVSKVLREYEELLPDHRFVRVHKSSIVNLDFVKEYHSRNGLQLILKNGEIINVSRRRAPDFFEKIKSYTNIQGDK
ncbi:DNA-binding response regulator [Pedobacter yulinensis]|uniref:DNA-binding response regulator n=1 Tax=Pedobacter yulinensis TaxID=2126353 RepID=A0A2T3HI47_9SPHI|nr:LytTR family DNA-binding domain-containing protein [Pedobacter yulinensis]PST82126.1 DNA-binding response regulator [Pedobacter yulinensis]